MPATTLCLLCGPTASEWCFQSPDGDHRPVLQPDTPDQPVAADPDREVLRRVINSAFGTDAAHGLIAARLVEAGWIGPQGLAAEREAAVQNYIATVQPALLAAAREDALAEVKKVHAQYFDVDGTPGRDDTTPEPEDVWRYDRDLRAVLYGASS